MVVHGAAKVINSTMLHPGVPGATGRKAGAGLTPHYAAADAALGYGKGGIALGKSHMCSVLVPVNRTRPQAEPAEGRSILWLP